MKHTILRALCLLCALLMLGTFALTGCGSETATETDPHAGHDHGTEGTTAPSTDAHDHKTTAAMGIAYETAADGTLTLTIKDCEGKLLCEQKGLAKKASTNQLGNGVVELFWVLNKNPGGYQCLYINSLTCQVSEMIAGEQVTDGNRIVYTEIKDGKLNVIVSDLFNKGGYYKVTELPEAYTAGAYTVLGAVKVKEQVNVSYLTDKDGAHLIKAFDLYEKGEEAPTTKKTESKK